MEKFQKLVLFQVESQRFAIPLHSVERVVSVVEISHLAKAPDFIMGTINVEGEILAVVNMRKVFNLPVKEIELSDQLMITQSGALKIGLWIDKTVEVLELPTSDIERTGKILLDTNQVKGIFKFEDDMVLLQDLDQLLTVEQTELLKVALLRAQNSSSTNS